MGLLDGRIAIITDADGSVAHCIATRLGIEGAAVFMIAPGDAGNPAIEIDTIVAKAGAWDILVNAAQAKATLASTGLADAVSRNGALAGLTRAVGVEWAADNIMENYLQSGAVDGPEFDDYRASNGAGVDHRIASLAISRLADPIEDVGREAVFLASDEGCRLVEHKVFADGGQHLVAPVQDYTRGLAAA